MKSVCNPSRRGKRTIVTLAVLGLVAAFAYGQLVGSANGDEKYLPEVFPGAAAFELAQNESVNNLYIARNNSGSQIGYISATEGQGYGGPMTVVVAWSPEGTILNVVVPEHREDMPWFMTLARYGFFNQYVGREYSEPLILDKDIDAVSGATVSSIGVARGVLKGRELLSEQLGDPYPMPAEAVKFGLAEVLLLVGLGTVVTLRMVPSLWGWRWPRFLTLLLGLAVLGIWLSIPLSLTNFTAWLVGSEPHFQTNVIMYILVFGVTGLAIALGKNFYCFWLCPFAAVQEGLYWTSGSNLRPTAGWRWLRHIRYFLLWLALFFVLLLGNSTVSVFEPWNVLFSFKGTRDQWLLMLLTLAMAVFIYNFWCYYLCPVGATMDIILKMRRRVVNLWGKITKSGPAKTI